MDVGIILGAVASAVAVPSFGILVWQQVQHWRARPKDAWEWQARLDPDREGRAHCRLTYVGTGEPPLVQLSFSVKVGGFKGLATRHPLAERGKPIEFDAWWAGDDAELLVEYHEHPTRRRGRTKVRRFPLTEKRSVGDQ